MKTLNIQNIIVPIDFSKMSVQAIQIAKQLARRFSASIHLAHVRQSNYTADFVAPAFMTYEQEGEQTALEELKKVASECGVSPAACDVLSGAPAFDEICRLGQTIPADLVVMPTHGRTGLKHVFLGSTAERIVQHSSCPVLVRRGNALEANNGARFRMKTILAPVDIFIDICSFAKDHDLDLIITSTHGFTGFTHVLIGRIAEQVVRHAPCSVLVVPSDPQSSEPGAISRRQGEQTG